MGALHPIRKRHETRAIWVFGLVVQGYFVSV